MISLRSSFTDFYYPTVLEKLTNKTTLLSGQYWILNSFFRIFFSSLSGTISLINAHGQLLIESSFFERCYLNPPTSGEAVLFSVGSFPFYLYKGGGAVTFYSVSSDISGISFLKVCAFNCTASSIDYGFYNSYYHHYSWGHFAYIYFNNQYYSAQKVFMKDTSITSCGPFSGCGRAPIYTRGGSLYYERFNSSNNMVKTDSSFFFENLHNLEMKFCTYSNSYSSDATLMRFNSVLNTLPIVFCNIINNTQIDVTCSLIYNSGSTIVTYDRCVFAQNITPYLFGRLNGALNIMSCWVEEFSYFATSPVFHDIKNLTSTFKIVHFGSALCLVPTPDPTDDPNQYTYGPQPTPPQTIPPSPTNCIIESPTPAGSLSLFSIFHILFVPLIFL